MVSAIGSAACQTGHRSMQLKFSDTLIATQPAVLIDLSFVVIDCFEKRISLSVVQLNSTLLRHNWKAFCVSSPSSFAHTKIQIDWEATRNIVRHYKHMKFRRGGIYFCSFYSIHRHHSWLLWAFTCVNVSISQIKSGGWTTKIKFSVIYSSSLRILQSLQCAYNRG